MAVVERKSKRARSGIVYWVATSWPGGVAWERAGTVRREAEALDAQRKREVKAGTFRPEARSTRMVVATWAETWLQQRNNRTASDDAARLRTHVLSRGWLAQKPIGDVTLADTMRLLRELQEEFPLERQKTVNNIYGVYRTLMRDARIERLVAEDVCTLPRGAKRKAPRRPRRAYSLEVVRALTTDDRLSMAYRVLWGLLFYTGMREGEACGRRWRDWDLSSRPLTALVVDTQYDGEPLKTDNPRRVPVHPTLERMLVEWREVWELVVCRKPEPDDFIVPNDGPRSDFRNHTKSSAYKAWRRSLERVGFDNHSLHSTRNTFITWCRRHRADPDALEVVTHNSAGRVIDQYTDWQWEPLCEAVLAFDAPFDPSRWPAENGSKVVEAPGIEAGGQTATQPDSAGPEALAEAEDPPEPAAQSAYAAAFDASQTGLTPAQWALVSTAHRLGLLTRRVA